ncbi:SUF system NifU family Fe-S cluster assembly protein [Facklamia sp. DSM 111018]|uniref:SUF system NifU family Fe-S cluster assembly protein n=1 Tax=Facklamia lactis TaxID=2749967 RepID=A0ABS0LSK5_9LACT|nr:SUF system NifU family Fe-S cluster assembly protein [Facklamia lactis]MBG9981376.1 SUF system NifU family Fe-S cluster assembly protein [Facklamia lactis]MBG9987148.1 SUF system NifU family Fe-S cluster assembly protein [Facklamia lactis]
MALNHLDQLYRAVVLDHSANPHHRGRLENATHQMELLNPTCGDAITVEMLVKENTIQDIAFEGIGCTISIASASMMTDLMMGKSIEEAIQLVQAFNQLVGGTQPQDHTINEDTLRRMLKDASILAGVKKFPARYKCAILSWRAVEYGLTQKEDTQALEEDGITRKEG